MRPLILQPDAAPFGASRALLRAIEAMPAGSVQPLVVFPYGGDALAEYAAAGCDTTVMDLAVLRRTSAGPAGLLRLARQRRATGRALGELARRAGCDLVHTNSMTIVSGPVAAHAAGIPHVWQLREAPVERGIKARVLRRMLAGADQVVAISRAAAELGPDSTIVVPDGYDVPDLDLGEQTRIGSPGNLLVGIVARISPTKAQHTAIDAIGDGMELVVCGTVYPGYEDYAEADVLARARARGILDRVHVTGYLDHAEALYRQLDVLVVATAAGEGLCMAALEAMAHGVPVVSCATGGITELVIDGVTGITCPPADAAAVARALEQLRDDPELRAALGNGARALAARYSVRASADGLLDAWRCAVKST